MATSQLKLRKFHNRWTPFQPHATQIALWNANSRFVVASAGRRSGKTEIAKRKGVLSACAPQKNEDAWYVFAAPTRDQAKRIFWRDLQLLVPPDMVAGRPSITELTISLKNGAEISVVGLDKPERIEGRPIDWICIDEMGNSKETVWQRHVRPALDTIGRFGSAWLIGVPRGRNHYYRMHLRGIDKGNPTWESFSWPSSDILPKEIIDEAKGDLDELTFLQEYEANWINFEGRAYYTFTREEHGAERLSYDPGLPLVFTLDFNVAPGTASVIQEQMYSGTNPAVDRDKPISCTIGEVWQPANSNTSLVCRKFVNDWIKGEKHEHKGEIRVYGDATGGARRTSALDGTDWDIVRAEFKAAGIYEQTNFCYQHANPLERVRVNATNARFKTADGKIHALVCPAGAPHTIEDYEGVTLVEGGSGEIDKKADPMLTHLSDGQGYYYESRFPLGAMDQDHSVQEFHF